MPAVINNMKAVLQEVRAGRMVMDYPLFWSMVHYIDVFPNRFHHPKEDDWLFARLKLRTSDANALIDELQAQHQGEAAVLGELRRWLGNTEAGVEGSFDGFEAAVNEYANFTWKHLRCEEHELLPLAEKHLLESDWADIAADARPAVPKPTVEEMAEALSDVYTGGSAWQRCTLCSTANRSVVGSTTTRTGSTGR